MPPTDLQLLTTILSTPLGPAPGQIKLTEKRMFQSMYDSLATGQRIGLSEKQKELVLTVYSRVTVNKSKDARTLPVEIKNKSLIGDPDRKPK